ncbi:Oidioi.mRNA.OKI2018_I69.PAR.g9384.t1.cds [Oikopleura dioica]|uniref:Oidioi.mRNA.OKI2018_I69.PAR.g9384.t1.cds n=1 Tax=Oikopleura dioica TaxID=34765 RepID=A0ABN7RPC6_OIKDI|nr:Oidioi.mRNA.OKI2018_I69.PAR.g9384.t1.cds [Oikopleura dioica]
MMNTALSFLFFGFSRALTVWPKEYLTTRHLEGSQIEDFFSSSYEYEEYESETEMNDFLRKKKKKKNFPEPTIPPTLEERACNPNWEDWQDVEGYSCQEHEDKGWCEKDGSFGPEWVEQWGPFSRLAGDEDFNALGCPQCGCIEAGAKYGDPHFHIKGKDFLQADLCFDIDGQPGGVLRLVEDFDSGLIVDGLLFRPDEDSNATYFEQIRVTSPNGVTISFDIYGWHVESTEGLSPSYSWDRKSTKFGDVYISLPEHYPQGKRVILGIENGPVLRLETANNHENVNFRFEDSTGISDNLGGVIGVFMPLGAYQILTKDPFSMAEEGVVLVNFEEEEVYEEVFFHRHNRDKNCWTIPKDKAATFVGKVISTANIYKRNA